MSRIILEVDDSVAAKWKASSQKLRKQVAELVGQVVDRGRVSTDIGANTEFIAYLDELREEMAARGLTQEALDEILKSE